MEKKAEVQMKAVANSERLFFLQIHPKFYQNMTAKLC